MEPRVAFFDGVITLIRPLICIQEKELLRYARAAGYPERPPCPYGKESKRAEIEAFLRQFGGQRAQVCNNLWRAAREAMGF